MSKENAVDPGKLVETLEGLKTALDTINKRLDNLEKRLKPFEREAEKKKHQQRAWERP